VIQIQKFVQELAARGDELLDHHTSPARAEPDLPNFKKIH
jgi:hypothetical protein